IDPTIPEGMNALVTRLMAKNPEDRYASADELADDLWKITRGREPTAATDAAAAPTRVQRGPAAAAYTPTQRVPTVHTSPVRRRRRRVSWFMVLLVALLLLLGTLGVLRGLLGPDFANGWFESPGENNPQSGPSASQTVKVPRVAGLTIAEARQRLTDAGLGVGQINSLPSDNVAAGRVIASGYSAGTKLPRDTEVNLDVSTGPQAAPSPSPTATAQPSPQPAGSASASATAQPSQQQNRQPARQPGRRQNAAPVRPDDNAGASPSPSAAPEDNAAPQGAGGLEDNSGSGISGNGNSGNGNGGGGNSGPGGGRGQP
ncbi:MAG TPA: PASTA domain-containing protein, partial [Rubrobacter sp.]|nr:PASTA domain-containing protein [Rubrobacter sp.]